jgi:hypothetical protein
MTTIWEITEGALDGLGVALAANVYVTASGTALPDEFMVYSLVSSPPELHADDFEELRSYRMQVSYFNRAGLINMPDIDGAMTAAGFSRSSMRELPYSDKTRHFGVALDYIYLAEQTVSYPGSSY